MHGGSNEESDITKHPQTPKEREQDSSRSRHHQSEFSGCQSGVGRKKEPEEEAWRGLKAPLVTRSESMT